MDTSKTFRRVWEAYEGGEILPACAWCGRVRIDEAWLLPSRAALAAIDERFVLSHSICEGCIHSLGNTVPRSRRLGTSKAHRSKE